MGSGKRASMREGPLANLFRKTETEGLEPPRAESGPVEPPRAPEPIEAPPAVPEKPAPRLPSIEQGDVIGLFPSPGGAG